MTLVRPYLVGAGNVVKSTTCAIGLIFALGMSLLAQTLELDTNGFIVALPADLEPPPGQSCSEDFGTNGRTRSLRDADYVCAR